MPKATKIFTIYKLVYVSEGVIKVVEVDYKRQIADFMNKEMKTEEEVILWKMEGEGYNVVKLNHHICKRDKILWKVAGDAYETTKFKIFFCGAPADRELRVVEVAGTLPLANTLNSENLMDAKYFSLLQSSRHLSGDFFIFEECSVYDYLEKVNSFEWTMVLDAP